MIETRGPFRRGWWVGLRGSSSNCCAAFKLSPGGSPTGDWVMSITSSLDSVLVVRNGVAGFACTSLTKSVGVGGVGSEGGDVITGYVFTW